MDLEFSGAEHEFRREVRQFCENEIPAPIRSKVLDGRQLTREEIVASHRILAKRGWSVPFWPVEWGGTGWSPIKYLIYREEMQAAGVPEPVPGNTYKLGPVLLEFGSAAQKEYFLPRLRNCDVYFCQGYSEPGAGSDLASLKMSATRARDADGEHYLLNGQKMWTSEAQHADWIFVLVRTTPGSQRQAGISFLLVDLKTPGITIRPIITINRRHETNEVFFDNVRVPLENRVGEEGRGWNVAKVLLSHERVSQAKVGITRARLRKARRVAAQVPLGSGTLADDRTFRRKLAEAEVELKALEITSLRVASAISGQKRADPISSVLKLRGTELQQRAAELLVQAAGPYALPFRAGSEPADSAVGPEWAAPAVDSYWWLRVTTIAAGSNEIQRNIIAKSFLGL